jgi:hypothetical protein
MRGSLLFKILRCQRWRLTRAEMKPMAVSCGSSPPSTTGIWARKLAVNSTGTFFRSIRTYNPCRKPSCCWRAISPSSENSCLLRSFCASTSFLAASRYSSGVSPSSSSSSLFSLSLPPPFFPFFPFFLPFLPLCPPFSSSSSSFYKYHIKIID